MIVLDRRMASAVFTADAVGFRVAGRPAAVPGGARLLLAATFAGMLFEAGAPKRYRDVAFRPNGSVRSNIREKE